MEQNEQEKITLPLSMMPLAEVVGFEAAIVIMDNFGGLSRFYIPRVALEKHKLAQLIGMENYTKLCRKFGGTFIYIPRGAFRRLKKSLIMEADKDVSNRKLCLVLGVTERYVLKVKSELKVDKQQGELFDKL